MTIPVWPAINSSTTMADFSIDQLAEPPLRTDMNAGTTRQRRKYTLPVAFVKVGIIFTAAEFATFQAFHQSLGDGAARFTMPVWNNTAYVTRTVAIKDGPTFAQWSFDRTKVVMTLRVENL